MTEQGKQIPFGLLIAISTTIVIGTVSCTTVRKEPIRRDGISMWSEMAGIVSAVERGDDPNALRRVDKLTANFKEEPGLAQALWLVGQQYYNKAVRKDREGSDQRARDYYRQAVALREKIIQQLPLSGFAAPAYFTAAVIYSQELHEYSKGIEYYQKVIDDWPHYKHAWHAQVLIGKYYEKLRDSGAMSPSQANPKIRAAYRAVVENYPDCRAAKSAARKLKQLKHKHGTQ